VSAYHLAAQGSEIFQGGGIKIQAQTQTLNFNSTHKIISQIFNTT